LFSFSGLSYAIVGPQIRYLILPGPSKGGNLRVNGLCLNPGPL
jgi:hypothetical protein